MKKILVWLLAIFVLLGVYLYIQRDPVATVDTVKEPVTVTDGKKISSIRISEEQTTLYVVYASGGTTTIAQDAMFSMLDASVVDVNYDNVDDIMVVVGAGAYNVSTYFLVLDEKKATYVEYAPFQRSGEGEDFEGYVLGAVTFDPANRLITSFFKGRGLGDMYAVTQYLFKNGSWNITKTEVQDILNYGDAVEYYFNTIVQYDADTLATTSEKTIYLKTREGGDIGDLVEVPRSELQKKKLVK